MQPVATPFFFYFLSALALISGILVITRRNAVHSALSLIVTLLALAGIYLMLYAPFVAGVLALNARSRARQDYRESCAADGRCQGRIGADTDS